MIDYSKVKVGDILRVTGLGAGGFAEIGDLVMVTEILPDPGIRVTCIGSKLVAEFLFKGGAERLEQIDTDIFTADLILEEISYYLVSVNSAQENIHICALRAMVYRRTGCYLTLRRVAQTIAAFFPKFKFKIDSTGPFILADLATVNKYTK